MNAPAALLVVKVCRARQRRAASAPSPAPLQCPCRAAEEKGLVARLVAWSLPAHRVAWSLPKSASPCEYCAAISSERATERSAPTLRPAAMHRQPTPRRAAQLEPPAARPAPSPPRPQIGWSRRTRGHPALNQRRRPTRTRRAACRVQQAHARLPNSSRAPRALGRQHTADMWEGGRRELLCRVVTDSSPAAWGTHRTVK